MLEELVSDFASTPTRGVSCGSGMLIVGEVHVVMAESKFPCSPVGGSRIKAAKRVPMTPSHPCVLLEVDVLDGWHGRSCGSLVSVGVGGGRRNRVSGKPWRFGRFCIRLGGGGLGGGEKIGCGGVGALEVGSRKIR